MGPDSMSLDGSETSNNNEVEISLDPGGGGGGGGGSYKPVYDASHDTVVMRHKNGDILSHAPSTDEQCGLFSWRPSCLQTCATLPAFTFFMSALSLFGSVNFSHFTAVISQIERQYGLSSSVSGFVKNIDNVGFLISVLLYSHFCRHSNKPRLLAITNIVASIAICCCALPHFIFKSGDPISDVSIAEEPIMAYVNDSLAYNISSLPQSTRKYEYCDGVGEEEATVCSKRSLNVGALVILIVAGLIQGAARPPQATLSLTYMDDTSMDASPKYFGFIFGSRSLAPVLGFLLGAWCTTIYVDLSNPGIKQTDPRWVGAWWIGFLICGAATVIWSFPLVLYPVRIPNKPKKHTRTNQHDGSAIPLQEVDKTDQSLLSHTSENGAVKHDNKRTDEMPDMSGDFVDNLKDMPRALCRLFRNPIFLFSIMGACCNMSLLGFITFLSKYIEMQFRQSPSMANIYTGCISAFAFSVGPIVSGRVISRFKVSAKKSLKLMVCVQLVSLAGFVGMTLMGCPQADWAGDPFRENSGNWSQPCNEGCACDEAEFSPICGADGYNYYSPCYAGCTGPENTTERAFAGCECVPSGRAEIGRCDPHCIMLVPYLLVLGVTSFVTSMFIVPLMTVLLRCVEERDKALSIALGTAFVNFAAFPAPIIYGLVVDSTCLVQQVTCGSQGACLFNDPTEMRYWLHGLEVIFKVMALVFFGLALFKSRNATFTGDSRANEDTGTLRTQTEWRLTSTSSMSM